jgi:hypothetical protein
MSGFNQDSQMPETAAGGDETAIATQHGDAENSEPSVDTTDRFGLQALGKGYLTRKYDIKISAAGQPYFTPVDSLLKQFVADAEDALAEARARVLGDVDLQARVKALADSCIPYFDARLEDCGEDRAWLARSMVIWPMTDQVGYQLYKACSGEADLIDYAGYLARTDANVKSNEDLDSHEGFQKRQFWTDLAYDELGVVDGVITEVDPDSISYNLEAIIRSGYQSAANLDTRSHLRGKTGNTPVTDDKPLDDFKAQVLASRRAASQAA